ncbi:dTDP-4-dehydrorhamnose reductase [Candidatus Liberibacter solanacearum]|uniref:dTDP-4-dehydrorhamnose reductase n=1 Tax=Candidatus Liberibacter solanacearum TaxID=556287 RepID=A0A1V2N711_9HYPH|nr:dTDP-4-dehydrorhamnose reductase [Candidatus Liberibacter solanacearum]ONI58608.1 dTDP-4-dehydrorhamnose reductase [Candidatus Liberibacter solanacearum]ONI59527.1 NAD(P)-dependent oxidoreductase [Candidatus Liberibacter solanacearum]
MKFLVIGNNGQVATSLFNLSGKNTEVIRLGRPDIDLLEPKDFAKIFLSFTPDVIINPAAYTAVDKAEDEPHNAFSINTEGAGAVAEAAESIGVPCIHISTDYVFDGSSQTPICETSPTNPLGIYGKSKLAGEEKVMSCTDNYVILRTAWVYSLFGTNFFLSMLRLSKEYREISVVCDQFGTPTSASQIAIAVIQIARNLVNNYDNSLRGIFHMTANGGPVSWADFAEYIFLVSTELGGNSCKVRRISTNQYPTKARRPAYSFLDCSKLEKIHNVRISSWKEGVRNIFIK